MVKNLFILFATFVTTGILVACGAQSPTSKADNVRAQQTEQLMQEAARQVPAPNIVNFTELRNATYLYELRDQSISTYTYIVDMSGNLHHLCDSIGFGIPMSAQITSPLKMVEGRGGGYYQDIPMPQPEPNGLFMPEGLSATFVNCANPRGGAPVPLYVEPEIIVSPMKLH